MANFFLLGALGAGAYLVTRKDGGDGLSGIMDVVANPAVFGVAAGVANGVLATVREKPMSVQVNLITAAVIGISEGVLTENKENATSVGFMSAIGAAAGMSLFTRFNPEERAIFENPNTPILGS